MNMKFFFVAFISLVFFSLKPTYAFPPPEVDIIDLPSNSTTVSLSDIKIIKKYFKEDLKDLAYTLLKNNKSPSENIKIRSVTYKEAENNFRGFISNIKKEPLNGIKSRFKIPVWLVSSCLSPQFYGREILGTTHNHQYFFPEQDNHAPICLFNAIKSYNPQEPSTKDDIKTFLEQSKPTWNLRTQILLPDEARKQYVTSDLYQRHLIAFAQKTSKPENDAKEEFDSLLSMIFNDAYFGKPNGFLSSKLIHNIYTGAKKTLEITKPGDNIVIFGNTPYFVGRALEHLVSKNPIESTYRNIISFPFSGSPNRDRENSFGDARDLVTEERLLHLKSRMKKVGLSVDDPILKDHTTFFLDNIGSGAGPAYVIEEILRDFREAQKTPPNLAIIRINNLNINDAENRRHSFIAKENDDKNGFAKLYFPSIHNPHFSIDSYLAAVPGYDILDNLPAPDCRVVPEYHPSDWQTEYDAMLTQDHPKHIKILLTYFDQEIKKIIIN